MSVTYGFYNSLNNDRKYNAIQMSTLFDGIINDGIFMAIGTAMMVAASSGMTVNVGEGRAWFNHTWTHNDALLPLTVDAAEVVLNRIDAVVLEVDSTETVRQNSIKIVKGTPASSPVNPTLIATETVNQHPLCYIYIAAGATAIVQGNITNKVGTSDCPFITGILETINTDALLIQWENQFTTWFANLEDVLDENVAANLLLMIEDLEKDYTKVSGYAVATGTTGNYSISLSPAPIAYYDGMTVRVKFNVDGAATNLLDVDGLGQKSLVKANNTYVTNIKANGIYTFTYSTTNLNFVLQGEGGSGDAIASDLLSGKKATVDAGDIVGTMPRKIGRINAVGAAKVGNDLIIEPVGGSYNWNDPTDIKVSQAQIVAAEPNILASNFLATKSVFGVIGSIPIRGSEEYTGYRRAVGLYGAPGRIHLYAPLGAYLNPVVDGFSPGNMGVLIDDANFVPQNWPDTISVLGLQGTMPDKRNMWTQPSSYMNNGSGTLYFGAPTGAFGGGGGLYLTDPDYIPSNLRKDTSVFDLVGTLEPKYYATGTINASSSLTSYPSTPNAFDAYFITVSGLSFTPNLIRCKAFRTATDGNDWSYIFTSTYSKVSSWEYWNYMTGTVGVLSYYAYAYNPSWYSDPQPLHYNSGAYISGGSFSVPVCQTFPGLSVTWEAIIM